MANLSENESNQTPSLNHRVKVMVGYTRNMGNYESLRVDIGLDMDGEGNPNATFDKVYSWCEKKLIEKVNEVEAELKA